MSLNKQRILNHSTEWAQQDGPQYRDAQVNALDDLREELGLGAGDIDEILDKPANWFSNRRRGGHGSHEFTLYDFEYVKCVLKTLKQGQDVHLDECREEAQQSRDHKIAEIEETRQNISVNSRRVDGSMDKSQGWWKSKVNSEDISLVDYHKVLVLVEAVAVVMDSEGMIDAGVIAQ